MRRGRFIGAAASAFALVVVLAIPQNRSSSAATSAPTEQVGATEGWVVGPDESVIAAGALLRAYTAGAGAASAEPAPGPPPAVDPATVVPPSVLPPSLVAADAPAAAAGSRLPIPASSRGIPGLVIGAYQRAARIVDGADPGCRLDWSLLAGIGRIESGHASGGRVDADGTTRGRILGPRLDGSLPGTAVIGDSDGGAFDGDAGFDRATGPMQFLPGTWRAYGADGNGDGIADPNNVYDAATAAGRYLCAGGGDLSTPGGVTVALFRYNRSVPYGVNVRTWADAYRTGATPVPERTDPVPAPPVVRVPPPASPVEPPPAPDVLAAPAASGDAPGEVPQGVAAPVEGTPPPGSTPADCVVPADTAAAAAADPAATAVAPTQGPAPTGPATPTAEPASTPEPAPTAEPGAEPTSTEQPAEVVGATAAAPANPGPGAAAAGCGPDGSTTLAAPATPTATPTATPMATSVAADAPASTTPSVSPDPASLTAEPGQPSPPSAPADQAPAGSAAAAPTTQTTTPTTSPQPTGSGPAAPSPSGAPTSADETGPAPSDSAAANPTETGDPAETSDPAASDPPATSDPALADPATSSEPTQPTTRPTGPPPSPPAEPAPEAATEPPATEPPAAPAPAPTTAPAPVPTPAAAPAPSAEPAADCAPEPRALDATATTVLPDGAGLLLRFALPDLPEGCRVLKATLRLDLGDTGDDLPMEVRRVTGEWSGGTTEEPGSRGPGVESPPADGPRTWTLTDLVAALYEHSGDSLLVRSAGEPAGPARMTITLG